MSTTLTLSKMKSMSGADLLALILEGPVSVEMNGDIAFSLVKPLNALDEKFFAVSSYMAQAVEAELNRKAENMTAEKILAPETVEAIIKATAALAPVEPKPAKAKPRKKPAPKKAAAPKKSSPPKKASTPKVVVKETVVETTVTQVAPIETEAFPENTARFDDVPVTDIVFEDLLLDENDQLIDETAVPTTTDATDIDGLDSVSSVDDIEVPVEDLNMPSYGSELDDDTWFDSQKDQDLISTEDLPLADDSFLTQSEDDSVLTQEEDDLFGDDTPIVRKAVKKTPVADDVSAFDADDDLFGDEPIVRKMAQKK